MIKTKKNITYVYNKKEEVLVFLAFNDQNDSLYKVKGWFGKKLDELLKGQRDFKQVLEEMIFSNQPKLRKTFQRFILTLVEENILEPVDVEGPSQLQSLSPVEWKSFGTRGLTGSIEAEELPNEEILAYAHGYQSAPSGQPAYSSSTTCYKGHDFQAASWNPGDSDFFWEHYGGSC